MNEIENVTNPTIHVRFAGNSYRFEGNEIDVGNLSSDNEIKSALARRLQVEDAKFSAYVVERHDNGNITVRPEAVFG